MSVHCVLGEDSDLQEVGEAEQLEEEGELFGEPLFQQVREGHLRDAGGRFAG